MSKIRGVVVDPNVSGRLALHDVDAPTPSLSAIVLFGTSGGNEFNSTLNASTVLAVRVCTVLYCFTNYNDNRQSWVKTAGKFSRIRSIASPH